ncbi:unnamed protein product [[Actinomadura] parvosata subsp. kistnae]|nr:hypothetical protein [Nonomuraea sp. ATCC 55076]SPL94303.1 unnamed protein product [Actinomadura parvosata subsp. kistnae]
MFRTTLDHPFVRAAQEADVHTTGLLAEREDPDVRTLGLLAEREETRRLLDLLSPGFLSRDLLQLWRTHGLARDHGASEDQGPAMEALIGGFFVMEALIGGIFALAAGAGAESFDHHRAVFGAGLRALIEPPDQAGAEVEAAAAAAHRLPAERRAFVRGLLPPAPPT